MGNLKKGIFSSMERKNINRGFKNLRVWQDAVPLYRPEATVFGRFPHPFKGVASMQLTAYPETSRKDIAGKV
jgi:hypothetical protein